MSHFRHDRSFETAGALSYTTLLALVPLLAVVIGVISAFPVFDARVEQLQDFIFKNFVPAAGDVVQQYIDQFIERSAGLTGAGSLFLVVAALLLMGTIEKSLNRIWRVDRPRSPASRLMVYWAVLTLGPLLIGASVGITSYLATLQAFAPEFVRGWVQSALLALTPFVVALLAFTLLFSVVPNRRVRLRHALAGATFSAVAFEVSKHAFVVYLSNVPTYEKLYGALATIPIFLVWIFVTWVVILLGASVSASLTTFNYRRADWRWNPRHHLLLVMRLIDHLAAAQREGRGRSSAELLALEEAMTDDELQALFDRLDRAGWIQRDESGDWFLTADLADVTLGDLYRDVPLVLPVAESEDLPERTAGDRRLRDALNEIAAASGPVLDRSLKSLLGDRSSTHNGS
ncbi:virulence factor BrkB family protein [Wenzhouxiangella sp. XN79A]|nr:virulence factor BrkB family protein [Wenzhouxiangella sp. XN79A]